MVCCGQLLSAQFPPNATVDDKNTIRQELVNQCGVRMAFCGNGDLPQNPPDNPVKLFLNSAKQCTVRCPDGNPFTYIIAAGTFAAPTQAQADKDAADAACVQAGLRKVCLGKLSGCLCVGAAYSATISHTGGLPPLHWSISSGALPSGLSIDQTGTISGTPTANGTFNFTVQARQSDGSYMRKPYTLSVLEITDTSLPTYTVGVAYSHQLTVAGGSGNYAVKLDSGVFPDGIVMDVTGLIHGTPTGLNSGTMPLVFDAVDTSCQATDRTFFIPRVALVGHSTTTISTLYGYSEYVPSYPPKKYHKITWTGQSEQTAFVAGGGSKVADAKYVYSGTGEIDTLGRQISNYNKDYYTPCPDSNFTPLINSIPNFGLFILKGYCWPTDPNSCPTCDDPPSFKRNEATNQIFDIPQQILDAGNYSLTSTTMVVNSGAGVLVSVFDSGPGGVTGVPKTTFNGFYGAWIHLFSGSDYSATLSDEYTDAEALTNAQVIHSNGLTAQSLPRTSGFVSKWTTVAFDLNFSNLVIGESYIATVSFLRQNPGGTGLKSYGFIAAATTHVIHDAISAPPDGGSTTVRNPTVSFSP